MSLGPIPRGMLKKIRDFDELSSLSLCLSVGGMSVISPWAVLVQPNGSNSAFSPEVLEILH